MLSNTKRRAQARSGFSLIEILVMVSIIAVLIALLMPAVMTSRETARKNQCQGKMKQLALALKHYEVVHGAFPSGVSTNGTGTCPTPTTSGAPWTVMLLPFMDQGSNHEDFNTKSGTYFGLYDVAGGGVNSEARYQKRPNANFECPSDPNGSVITGGMNYLGIMGGCADWEDKDCCSASGNTNRLGSSNGMFFNNSKVRDSDLVDGKSHVLMLGESIYVQMKDGGAGSFATWASGYNVSSNPMYTTVVVISNPINGSTLNPAKDNTLDVMTRSTGSYHGEGANFAMAGGRVSFINEKIDVNVFRQLARRDDELPLGGLPK